MGAAQSSNFVESVINSYANVLQQTTNTAMVNSYNEAILAVSGGSGDVSISNVKVEQAIENSVKATFKSTNDSTVLQKVSQQMEQQAASTISGLNLGNFSEASNSMRTAINTSMSVSQIISTSCSSTAANMFKTAVTDREGNVDINNVDVKQTVKNSLECIGEAVNKSTATMDVSNVIKQTATAKTEGLSLGGMIVLIIAAVLCAFVMTAGKLLGKGALVGGVLGSVGCLIYGEVSLAQNKTKLETEQKRVKKVVERNKKIDQLNLLQRPVESVKGYYYTCGIRGISSVKNSYCFNSTDMASFIPTQGVAGCSFTELLSSSSFSKVTASDANLAIAHFMKKDSGIDAMDLIWKPDGSGFDLYFYNNVSPACITAMDAISNDTSITKLPTITCEMLEPVEDVSTMTASDNCMVIDTTGRFYVRRNSEWQQQSSSSMTTIWPSPHKASVNTLFIKMVDPAESENITIKYAPTMTGFDIMYVSLKKGTSFENVPSAGNYVFTVWTPTMTDQQKDTIESWKSAVVSGGTPTTDSITITPDQFVKISDFDVTDMVKNQLIGPFMANPDVNMKRNTTLIADPTYVEDTTIDEDNTETLNDLSRQIKLVLAGLICLPFVMLIILAVGAYGMYKSNDDSDSFHNMMQSVKSKLGRRKGGSYNVHVSEQQAQNLLNSSKARSMI